MRTSISRLIHNWKSIKPQISIEPIDPNCGFCVSVIAAAFRSIQEE